MSTFSVEASLPRSLSSTFGVDFVIVFDYKNIDKARATAQFVKLVESLDTAGLTVQVRQREQSSLFIFIKIKSEENLKTKAYDLRLQEWVYGVAPTLPPDDISKDLEENPITEAERLRTIYSLITNSKNEGGAGITPTVGEWDGIKSIFPLHDPVFNKSWITKLSTKYYLSASDLDEVRGKFGEKIAFYFAFLQTYFLLLTLPAGFGLFAWLFLDPYSPTYAVVNGLWSIFFLEYWKKQQDDLAVQWGVKDITSVHQQQTKFKTERNTDSPAAGEYISIISFSNRFCRQLPQFLFIIAAVIAMGSLISTCFSIEIFLSEVYVGPFKQYLIFLPTLILSTAMPKLSSFLRSIASSLTDLESHEIRHAREVSMIQKIFVLDFIMSYLPIFLTAFIYVPFARVLVPILDVFHLLTRPGPGEKINDSSTNFQINPDRLKKQVIYFTVTAQIIGFGSEVIFPYARRKFSRKINKVQSPRASKINDGDLSLDDNLKESSFLRRVVEESNLEIYDVTTDFREMVVQFGYLSLFSVIWPLTAGSFFINNWIEIRGDALKIVLGAQRPIPWRAESIGPWIDDIKFLTWLGSLTSAALVYLFSGGKLEAEGAPWNINAWGLLLTIFFSEHIYSVIKILIGNVLSQIDNPKRLKDRYELLLFRKQYIQAKLGQRADDKIATDKIYEDENAYKDKSDQKFSNDGATGDQFWKYSFIETITLGKSYITEKVMSESKKEL